MWNKDWKKGVDYPTWGDTDVYKKTIGGGYLYNGETEFGPETEKMPEPEYGHQRKWVDACKAGFNSKEHLELTSSFDYAGPMT